MSSLDPAMLPTLTVLPTSTADLTPTDGGTGAYVCLSLLCNLFLTNLKAIAYMYT